MRSWMCFGLLITPFALGQDGSTLVFPWVSKNTQFESIIFLNNVGPDNAQVRLQAHRGQNRQGAADSPLVTIEVPAFALFESTASQLFPSFGDGSGYTLIARSDSVDLHGGWVTNNLTAGSGKSPSQGKAIRIDEISATGSPFLGESLLYSYLPVTDGLTSAPVIVNVGDLAADVTLEFVGPDGEVASTTTIEDLAPLRPFAAVVNTLVPNAQTNLMLRATSDTTLTGVAFVFNDASEPSIGNAVTQDAQSSGALVFPWVSNNSQFESIVVVNNLRQEDIEIVLTARRGNGEQSSVTRSVASEGFLESLASELFPDLGSGSGFAIEVETPDSSVFGAWVTNNLETISGRSPSQGNAILLPKVIGQQTQLVGPTLLLSYLPVVDGLTSAPVILNVGNEAADVQLYFYTQDGALVASETLSGTKPFQPFAAVANTWVETNSYVIAQSQQPLTGVSFVFNSDSEPSIGNGSQIVPQLPLGSSVKASATIGVDGGVLTDGAFKLTVPRNAFDGSYDLKLHSEPASKQARFSGSFYISGLPTVLLKALTIEAPVEDGIDQISLLIDSQGWANEVEAEVVSTSVFNAIVNNGVARGLMPPSESGDVKSKALRRIATAGAKFSVTKVYESQAGHFRISDLLGNSNADDLESLGDALEEAYDDFEGLGFSYARRTFPITVSLLPLTDGLFGYHDTSLFGLNYHKLVLNSNGLSDRLETANTAYHEFFHFVQYLYDPRGNWDRAKKPPPHHWVNEASAAWIEGLYSMNPPEHQSTVFADNADAIRWGAEYGANARKPGGNHGYGMASFFKFGSTNLFSNQAKSVVDIYEEIYAGKNHVDAILEQIPQAKRDGSWWQDYAKSFSSSEIYQVEAFRILDASSQHANVHVLLDSTNFVSRTFQHFKLGAFQLFPDLSNDYFQLRPRPGPHMKDSHIAFFNVVNLNGDPMLNMYTCPQRFFNTSDTLAHVISSEEQVVVSNLKAQATSQTNIVAEVSNAAYDAPYRHLSITALDLDFRLVIFRFVNNSNQFIHILLPEEPFVREVNRLDTGGGCRCTYLQNGGDDFFTNANIPIRAGFNGQVLLTANVDITYSDSFITKSEPLVATVVFENNTLKVSYAAYNSRFPPCTGCDVQGDLFPPADP